MLLLLMLAGRRSQQNPQTLTSWTLMTVMKTGILLLLGAGGAAGVEVKPRAAACLPLHLGEQGGNGKVQQQQQRRRQMQVACGRQG